MSQISRVAAALALLLATVAVSACDSTDMLGLADGVGGVGVDTPASATPTGPVAVSASASEPQSSWACANIQSASVCRMTASCRWVPGIGECVDAGGLDY